MIKLHVTKTRFKVLKLKCVKSYKPGINAQMSKSTTNAAKN